MLKAKLFFRHDIRTKHTLSQEIEVYIGWTLEIKNISIINSLWFPTREEARQDAMEWARKLGVEVEG